MKFEDKLIQARATLNLTQSELAKELNVSFQTINRWESGKFKPTKKAEVKFDLFCKNNNIFFKGDSNE